jgi:hypothetical protein
MNGEATAATARVDKQLARSSVLLSVLVVAFVAAAALEWSDSRGFAYFCLGLSAFGSLVFFQIRRLRRRLRSDSVAG